jgi:hypothetical protein
LTWQSREVFELDISDNASVEEIYEIILDECGPDSADLVDWSVAWNEVIK